MAGIVQHSNIGSPTGREKLKTGRQPHWQALVPGKVHLGWQRWKGDAAGRWVLRRYIGSARYRTETLGRADDDAEHPADGKNVLTYMQAKAAAEAKVATNGGKIERLTVRDAMARYIDFKRSSGQPVDDLKSRNEVRILPELGDLVVSELSADDLRKWLATMAESPVQYRPKAGKPQYRPAPKNDEEKRRRQASANRVLNILKAALNHAFDEGHVSNRDAWGRRLKPFKKADAARLRYFTIAEAKRVINACGADFRPLVRAALESGCRYGELTRLEVADFHVAKQQQKNGTAVDVGTLTIRQSKTEPRAVVLTDEGTAFFREHCAGRTGLMFTHGNGKPWQKSEQARPMRAACEHAKIKPAGFHQLRHTWASHAVMNGMPLMVVARNLGHVDTKMVQKHYGHLAPSFITEAIRTSAPVYGIKEPKKVVPLG
jgi:integrase